MGDDTDRRADKSEARFERQLILSWQPRLNQCDRAMAAKTGYAMSPPQRGGDPERRKHTPPWKRRRRREEGGAWRRSFWE